MRYDIYRRRFDARQLTFGEPQLVLNASADSLSATLPRISPDGRWLLTSIGGYGCFHVYHPEADLPPPPTPPAPRATTTGLTPADGSFTRAAVATTTTRASTFHTSTARDAPTSPSRCLRPILTTSCCICARTTSPSSSSTLSPSRLPNWLAPS